VTGVFKTPIYLEQLICELGEGVREEGIKDSMTEAAMMAGPQDSERRGLGRVWP